MMYRSLNGNAPDVDFSTAAIAGIAPDKGLYFPLSIPVLDNSYLKNLENFSDAQIAFDVIRPYVGTAISEDKLFTIVSETIDFPIPLKQINEDIFSLELFHGPTLAFKDIGARFMSRCLAEVVPKGNEIVVLVATSGDTGGAVAHGFYDVPGIRVVILYPKGKVSAVQEMQLTALGKNVHALEIDGNFDNCQSMVKQAFLDKEINDRVFLTSANSINVARWLPQQFYYFLAYKQWKTTQAELPVICVPSGNFGNLCAGVLAACSGLPVKHFIAACNANDSVYQYFKHGKFAEKETIVTYSNAMDVGNPSNFLRLIEMLNANTGISISADSISDEETLQTIRDVYNDHNYLLDPHGAVAYNALNKYLESHNDKGIILETAHPVKFPDVVEKVINETIAVPAQLAELMKSKKSAMLLTNHFSELKDYLMHL
jgi:threonine synthase